MRSDAELRALVLAELDGLSDAAIVRRTADLVEFFNRVLVVELSDRKALAAVRMRETMDNWEISAETEMSPQQVRKLLDRGRIVERIANHTHYGERQAA